MTLSVVTLSVVTLSVVTLSVVTLRVLQSTVYVHCAVYVHDDRTCSLGRGVHADTTSTVMHVGSCIAGSSPQQCLGQVSW